MILNKTQAVAVFKAIAEINNISVGHSISISFAAPSRKSEHEYEVITIREDLNGGFLVTIGGGLLSHEREQYVSYFSFYEAYKKYWCWSSDVE